jgi:hypothetical protein
LLYVCTSSAFIFVFAIADVYFSGRAGLDSHCFRVFDADIISNPFIDWTWLFNASCLFGAHSFAIFDTDVSSLD